MESDILKGKNVYKVIKWLYDKGWIILYVLAAIGAVAFFSQLASGYELAYNETYTFNYIEAINVSNGTCTIAPRYENFSCGPSSCETTNVQISLSPGETTNNTQQQCRVTASCEECDEGTEARCIINKDLSPGDDYTNTAGLCDIDISVDECDYDKECDVEFKDNTYTYRESLSIYIDNNSDIRVEYGNDTVVDDLSRYSAPLYVTYPIEVTCPNDFEFRTKDDEDEIMRVLGEFSPFIVKDFLEPTLQTCQRIQDEYVNNLAETPETLKNLYDTLGSCQANKTAYEAQVAALSDKIDGNGGLTQRVVECEQNLAGSNTGLVFIAITCVVLVMICLWQFMTIRRAGQ